jgi:hypothetical protein
MIVQTVFYSVFIILGGLAVLAAGRNILQVRTLTGAEHKQISQVRPGDGPVIIEGTIEPTSSSNQFEGPFSGEASVAYSYEIEREKDSGETDHLETVEEQEERTAFYVSDETGTAHVDPSNARLVMEQETDMSIERGTSLAQRLNPARFGWENFTYFISGQSLLIGDDVSVYGAPTNSPTQRQTAISIGEKTEETDCIISDTNPTKTVKRLSIQAAVFFLLGFSFIIVFGYLLIT